MKFNKYFHLNNKHSFLSPSSYAWIRYDEQKLVDAFNNYTMAQRGTKLHEIAADLIKFRIKLPKTKNPFNQYVNDGIGFGMETEQTLYYSDFCFGTTDSIMFKNNLLRIHDLKTGKTKASFDQLLIYVALFSLEYKIDIKNINVELRIYQDDVYTLIPEIESIQIIKQKIIQFNKKLIELEGLK